MGFMETREDMAAFFDRSLNDGTIKSKITKYRVKHYHDYVLKMWDRFGCRYFTPLQWIILSFDQSKLYNWIEWVQNAEGDYIE